MRDAMQDAMQDAYARRICKTHKPDAMQTAYDPAMPLAYARTDGRTYGQPWSTNLTTVN